MNWSFRVGSIWGIPIRLHWTLLFVVAYYAVQPFTLRTGLLGAVWLASLLAMFFVAVLVHELGHCWAARRVGQYADQIVLWPLGGMAYVGQSEDPREDMFVTFMGPATHLLLGGAAAAAILVLNLPWKFGYLNPLEPLPRLEELGIGGVLLVEFIKMNLRLMAFNLLVPAFPLDGGRILLNLLTLRYGSGKAMRIAWKISLPIGVVFMVVGFLARDLFLGFIGIMVVIEALQMKVLVTVDESYSPSGYSDRGYAIQERREGWLERRRRLKREREAARRAREEAELRRRVDELLEKVAREGMGALTPAERKILERASERLRQQG